MKHRILAATSGVALSALLLAAAPAAERRRRRLAADCAPPADGPVTLDEFTSWIPGIEKVVEMWNSENPDIQVKVQTGPNGNSGTYQNFFNQIAAAATPRTSARSSTTRCRTSSCRTAREHRGLLRRRRRQGPVSSVGVEPGRPRRGRRRLRRPPGHRPDGAVLPQGPLREERDRVPTTWDEYTRGREEDPGARRVHHQLLAVRQSTSSRASSGRPAASGSATTRTADRLAHRPRVEEGRRVLAVPSSTGPRLDLPA